jgi:hypothetical protein
LTLLELRVKADGDRNRLEIYHEGTHIGDYERSIDKHVDAKREEAEGAVHLLLDAYRRYGKIAVRWNSSDRTKRSGRSRKARRIRVTAEPSSA